jgi:hypothetical protein
VSVATGTAVFHSTDGGTTWTLVHDPATERPSWVSDIEYPPGGGAARRAAVAAHERTLVGTDSGVYEGDLAATSGLFAVCATAGGSVGSSARISTLASDGSPDVAINPVTRTPLAVFQRSDGLSVTSGTGSSWSIPAPIPGTQAGDVVPALAIDRSGGVDIAFRRTAGPARGVYLVRRIDGEWTTPRRVSTLAGDTLPALAVRGTARTGVHIVLLRSGRLPGVYEASYRAGKWHLTRVSRTGARDAKAVLGAPTLAADRAGKLRLAFTRASGKPGIYFSTRGAKGWSAPRRLTAVAGDRQPSLAVTSKGVSCIVFRRPGGRGARGLFFLRGATRWSLARIPGTRATDTQPDLVLNGATLRLAFVRPSGAKPGVYFDRRTVAGRWLAAPRRRSIDRADAHARICVGPSGLITIAFERR